MTKYLLDAWALIAWLEKESNYLRVRELFTGALNREVELGIGIVNFGEVYYRSAKRHGISKAETVEGIIRTLPMQIISPLTEKLVMRAANIKALHPISYADAFAAALAEQEESILVTGDTDFERVEELIDIE